MRALVLGATLLASVLQGAGAGATVTIQTNRAAFLAQTGAVNVPFPDADVTGTSLTIGNIIVRDVDFSTIGLDVPPYSFVDAPNPLPPEPTTTIIGINGEEHYELIFGSPVTAVGLGLVTNVTAQEDLTVYGLNDAILYQASIDELTSPNTIFFLGVVSTETITRMVLDTTNGIQNEVIFEILIGMGATLQLGPFQPLGGSTPSAPELVYDSLGTLHVLVRGQDDGIWHRTRTAGGALSGWMNDTGGSTLSGLAATLDPTTGEVHLFARGLNNGIWQNTLTTAGTWLGWTAVGGATLDGLGAATNATGHTTVAARGLNDGIWLGEATPPQPGDLCVTKTATVDDSSSSSIAKQATWVVTNPCDGNTLNIDITPLTSDGFSACVFDLAFVQGGVQFDATFSTWFDTNSLAVVCGLVLPGATRQTTVDIGGQNISLNFLQPFTIFYADQQIFEFP